MTYYNVHTYLIWFDLIFDLILKHCNALPHSQINRFFYKEVWAVLRLTNGAPCRKGRKDSMCGCCAQRESSLNLQVFATRCSMLLYLLKSSFELLEMWLCNYTGENYFYSGNSVYLTVILWCFYLNVFIVHYSSDGYIVFILVHLFNSNLIHYLSSTVWEAHIKQFLNY